MKPIDAMPTDPPAHEPSRARPSPRATRSDTASSPRTWSFGTKISSSSTSDGRQCARTSTRSVSSRNCWSNVSCSARGDSDVSGHIEASLFQHEIFNEDIRRATDLAEEFTESPFAGLGEREVTDERQHAAALRQVDEAEADRDRETLAIAFTNATRGTEPLVKLSRYEVAIERSLYRALHELQRLQAARQGLDVAAPPSSMSRCQDRQADSDAPRSKGPTRNYETNPIRPGTSWRWMRTRRRYQRRETGDLAAREPGNWRCVDHQSHSASNGIHEIFNQVDLRLTKIDLHPRWRHAAADDVRHLQLVQRQRGHA